MVGGLAVRLARSCEKRLPCVVKRLVGQILVLLMMGGASGEVGGELRWFVGVEARVRCTYIGGLV